MAIIILRIIWDRKRLVLRPSVLIPQAHSVHTVTRRVYVVGLRQNNMRYRGHRNSRTRKY